MVAALALVLAGCGKPAREAPRPARPGVRISMEELHRLGGVPPRWQLQLPPGDVGAGRAAFGQLRCHTCHKVAGEPFGASTGVGPELTGMGRHHPPGYFAEAIINPDAVLVEGPGHIGADGRSTMPAYPYISVQQLADLVAYLSSLTGGGPRHGGMPVDHAAMGHGAPPARELPAPPPGEARSFFVQIYDVANGRLGEFERWFQSSGAPRLLAHDGLVSIETYVDLTREGPSMVSVFGFRSEEARERFLADPDPAAQALAEEFDSFIGPHPHRPYARPPLYRAPSLSAP